MYKIQIMKHSAEFIDELMIVYVTKLSPLFKTQMMLFLAMPAQGREERWRE